MGRIISLTKSAFRDNEANFEKFLSGEKLCDVELMVPKANTAQASVSMVLHFLLIVIPNFAYLQLKVPIYLLNVSRHLWTSER